MNGISVLYSTVIIDTCILLFQLCETVEYEVVLCYVLFMLISPIIIYNVT